MSALRVLLVAVKDLAGGAHRSAYRLHQALRGAGVDSVMVVREKASADPHVVQLSAAEMGWPRKGRGVLDRLPSPCLVSRDDPISLGIQSIRLDRVIASLRADVVHLHWVNGGMVSIAAAAAATKPVVWTLHDMWAFTGGCHYAGNCMRFRDACEACPKVRRWPIAQSVPHWVHGRKARLWGHSRLNAIAPSQWMAQAARASSLFRNADIRQIGYCFDPTIFRPEAREAARSALGIPAQRRCVLFVNANQRRKGSGMIARIIQELTQAPAWGDCEFLFAGGLPVALRGDEPHVRVLPPTHDEATMAGYFAAADLFAMPSLEDNLPNTIIESLACGTPVAAFAVGGIQEMIVTGENGCLIGECTATGMADSLKAFRLEGLLSRATIAAQARGRYSQDAVARQHLDFYEDIVERPLPARVTR